MPGLPSIADVLERLQALEIAVEERDLALVAANKRCADLAAFQQEALAARERLVKLHSENTDLTDELDKARRELAELRPRLAYLQKKAEENSLALAHARALANSVEQLNALLGK